MTKQLGKKPEVTSQFAQKELDKAEAQFEKFSDDVKSLTQDRMNQAPKEESHQQTKISENQAQKEDGIWLKPLKSSRSVEKFNERFRGQYDHSKKFVKFIAENRELMGMIEIWTKPFPGVDAEYWEIPCNKVVWGPRYLADQIKRCSYHRLTMDQSSITGSDGRGSYFGTMVADSVIQRLDAFPVGDKKTFFSGASNF